MTLYQILDLYGKINTLISQCRRPRFDPWVRKIPWRRKWQPIPVLFLFKLYLFVFNWLMIASQYWFEFYHTSAWISHRCACLLFLEPSSYLPTLPHPSSFLQSPGLSSLCPTANSHWLSILHMVVHMLPCSPPFISPSPSSPLPLSTACLLCLYLIAVLQLDSLVPSF